MICTKSGLKKLIDFAGCPSLTNGLTVGEPDILVLAFKTRIEYFMSSDINSLADRRWNTVLDEPAFGSQLLAKVVSRLSRWEYGF